jgi:pimeloyl-ACP methyl ester carboxylesterase
MPQRFIPTLQAYKDIAVWSGGNPQGAVDIWFLHAFADSHLCFRPAFSSVLAERAHIYVFDLPGHGASPPRLEGLTVDSAADIWCDLLLTFSASRSVILVGHSMASIIATRAAQLLHHPPRLVISLEGNLTLADAYLTGQAAQFQTPEAFFTSFQNQILRMAEQDDIMRRYAASLQFADPATLWALGRSVVEQPDPGMAFVNLACPKIYYWDSASISEDAQAFLRKHSFPQRKFDGLGHWPMVKSAEAFYAALDQDIQYIVGNRS